MLLFVKQKIYKKYLSQSKVLNLIWKNEKETDLENHELAIKSASSQEPLHWNGLWLTKEKANLSICKIV